MAQKELFFSKMDTIPYGYRSGGVALDSVDAAVTITPNLRPGLGFGELFEKNLAESMFNNEGGFSYLRNEIRIQPKFSGLPYLGFQYAFGSKLTQDLQVEYQQFYSPNTHLHLRYNRNTSNGFLRNSGYRNNDLNLRFYHQKSWFATHFDGYYGAYNLHQNRGIATDTLLQEFAIEFTPVITDEGESKIRKVDLKWDNYFRLAGDSLLGFGLKSKHAFDLTHREFTEFLMDNSIVDTTFIDTNGYTRDQFQTASLINGAGAYFSSSHFKIDATANHRLWRNQNLGTYRDTNEVFLHSNLWVALGKRIDLHNEFYFNLIGATGELKEYARLNFAILDQLSLRAAVNFENLYPTPYQRYHSANYYQWEIDELKMQQRLQVKGSLRYGKENFVQADVVWTSINNGRYFINGEWRQDTLDFVSVGALQLKGAYRLKKFAFYPSATLRFNSSNFAFQPLFSTMNRITFSTKLFKAQKLGLATGVDIGYDTEYQHLMYNGVLDIYDFAGSPYKTSGLMKLNAFLALSIDEFRFFVKAENLSYFFQDETTRIDPNYPIMPFLIRLGITWDFFN